MTISLRHCVREAQHGNHEAVLFLLHEFEPLIRKYVKKYYMYYESLEEAISTADHAIVDCIFTFDLNKQDNPKDYKTNNVQRRLLAAVHNAFEYESYRKQCYLKRVQKNIVESDIVTDFPYNWAAPEEETPEHCLLKKDRKEQVWKALNRLNETQRTLIVAHYIHNQTYDYISKKYGIEKSKVRRIIKRGLNVLRCLLE